MVKKLIAAIVFSYASMTMAEVNMTMPVICVSKKDLVTYLNEFEEKPLAVAEVVRQAGDAGLSNITLFFVNPKTSTWTVAEKVANDLYCIILSGIKFSVVP